MKRIIKSILVLAGTGCTVMSVASEAQAISLEFDSQYGSPGFGPGELFVPQGIAIQEGTDNVYIIDVLLSVNEEDSLHY